ncbi:MAG: secondary thiamine-phosphate synthase enzyme YjbQ [Candidatus Firestonebacteria bacterium]
MIYEISVQTTSRTQFKDITDDIQKVIIKSKAKEGICFIFIPHTTAGITINENADPSVREDIIEKLADVIPENSNYSHAEGNSDAHIKASMVGFSQTVFIEEGKLLLGTWQGIYFCEFDGPRTRKVMVKII